MISMYFVLFFGVVYSQFPLHSPSHIFHFGKGNLSEEFTFNFTIWASDLKGIILHCFDSEKNQFDIRVLVGRNDPISLYVSYNERHGVISIKDLCGCDICTKGKFKFDIHFKQDSISIICNKRGIDFSLMTSKNGQNNNVYILPFPDFMVNTTDTLYFGIGNIGPYYSIHQVTIVKPIKEQMVGCLDTFMYNNAEVTFKKNGTKIDMETTCSNQCSNNSYNKDSSRKNVERDTRCHCSSEVFRESNCLKSTIPEGKTPSKNMTVTFVHLSISWNERYHRTYCLLDVTGRDSTFQILTNMTHIWLDSRIIFIKGINNINVTITNYSLTSSKYGIDSEFQNKELKINVSLDFNTIIKVGESNERVSCETNPGERDETGTIDLTRSSISTSNHSTELSMKLNSVHMILISAAINIPIIFIIIALYKKIRSWIRKKVSNQSAREIETLPLENVPITPPSAGPSESCTIQEDSEGYTLLIPKLSRNCEPTLRSDTTLNRPEELLSDSYSEIDYAKMYYTKQTGSYLYVLPTQNKPPLPPRNEE